MGLKESLDVEGGKSILKNPNVLLDTYIPDKLLFREKELGELVVSVRNLLRGKPGMNVLLFGMPSTGKTHAVRLLQRDFNELAVSKGYPARAIYVSARGKTLPKVWMDIANEASRVVLGEPYKYSKTDMFHAMKHFVDTVNSADGIEGVLLILDELDSMVPSRYSKPNARLLEAITRLHENGLEKHYNFILVTNNDKVIFENIDAGTASRLSALWKIYFREYYPNEIAEILRDRIRQAFVEGAVTEQAVNFLSAVTMRERRDLRFAFYLLYTAGMIAEMEGLERITDEFLRRIYSTVRREYIKDKVKSLTESELFVFLAILWSMREGLEGYYTTTPDIYEAVSKFVDVFGKDSYNFRRTMIRGYILPILKAKCLIDIYSAGKHAGRSKGNIVIPLEDYNTLLDVTVEVFSERFNLDPEQVREVLKRGV
ncbi:Cdc6/Cdc18 family protein [Pyrococcus kukulkanii]|uniref:AAA family ATPase n=1 Tax=Pyrococcus kukulkanii TaxID=1609559 RepID=A0ABV4T5Z0_9EURY